MVLVCMTNQLKMGRRSVGSVFDLVFQIVRSGPREWPTYLIDSPESAIETKKTLRVGGVEWSGCVVCGMCVACGMRCLAYGWMGR